MGTVIATIEIGDLQRQNFKELELEVDTGSTHTAVPRKLLEALGVPVTRVAPSRLTDGTIRPANLGDATVRIAGNQFVTTVIFAEEGEHSLLGVVTLEQAQLAVDPVNGELIPVAARR